MSLKFRFTRNEVLKLFMICAFPAHFWTIVVIILNADLIDKRNFWYYTGYSGYLLGMALLESILLFIFIIGLSFLFPKNWTGNTPLNIAGAIALIIGFWGISNQLFFYIDFKSPEWFSWIMLRVHYRQKQLYPFLVAAIAASAAVPLYALSQSKKTRDALLPILENIGLLSYLYLAVDIISFVVVLLRNAY